MAFIEMDFASGGSMANNYSYTERVVGTWVNGETLYERVFAGTSPSTMAVSELFNIAGVDKIWLVGGYYKDQNDSFIPPNSETVWTWCAVTVGTNVGRCYTKLKWEGLYSLPYEIIVQYTKV